MEKFSSVQLMSVQTESDKVDSFLKVYSKLTINQNAEQFSYTIFLPFYWHSAYQHHANSRIKDLQKVFTESCVILIRGHAYIAKLNVLVKCQPVKRLIICLFFDSNRTQS